MSPKRALNLLTIMIIVDAIGFGLIAPSLSPLLQEITGSESGAALWIGILFGIDALMRFIFAPLITGLSDRVGRKPILILAAVGSIIDYAILAFVPSLAVIMVGRIIGGITNAYLPTINAYIADISPEQDRVRNFGRLGAAFSVGFVIGPALGGLLGGISLQLPFIIVMGLVGLNLLFIFFLLPESLKEENRQKGKWQYENPVKAIMGLRRYGVVGNLGIILLLLSIGEQTLYATWVIYTRARYDWGTTETGLSLSIYGLAGAVLEGVLVARIVKRLGERRTILISLIAATITYILFGLAPVGWMIYVIIPFSSLGFIYEPPIQTLITGNVPPDQQGTVQGALTGLTSIAAVIGPVVGGGLLSYLLSPNAAIDLPGGTFFLSAIVSFGAVLLAQRTFRKYSGEIEKSEQAAEAAPNAAPGA